MPATSRVLIDFSVSLRILFVCAALIAAADGAVAGSRAMQEPGAETGAEIRIVHGIANAGPLDVYIDDSLALIGVVFAETSSEILIAPGVHAFAVVPSGATLGDAIADGTIELESGNNYFTALLGSADAASVGLFAVDDRALDAGTARFRVISGVSDAGEFVPAFTGGDVLSEPLRFGDASEYAAIDAGVYDLDLLDATSGSLLLGLAQTEFAEGTVTDIIVVGQLGEATVQALIIPTNVGVALPVGRSAQVVAGTCAELGALAASIGVVQIGQGELVGIAEILPVSQGYGLAPMAFATLTTSPHVVTITESADESEGPIACGEIGGPLTDTGALVIALRDSASGEPAGVAVLAPGLEDPQATGISVFHTDSE